MNNYQDRYNTLANFLIIAQQRLEELLQTKHQKQIESRKVVEHYLDLEEALLACESSVELMLDCKNIEKNFKQAKTELDKISNFYTVIDGLIERQKIIIEGIKAEFEELKLEIVSSVINVSKPVEEELKVYKKTLKKEENGKM